MEEREVGPLHRLISAEPFLQYVTISAGIRFADSFIHLYSRNPDLPCPRQYLRECNWYELNPFARHTSSTSAEYSLCFFLSRVPSREKFRIGEYDLSFFVGRRSPTAIHTPHGWEINRRGRGRGRKIEKSLDRWHISPG